MRFVSVRAAVLVTLALVGATACEGDAGTSTTTAGSDPVALEYDFVAGSDGWASDVSDFSDQTRPENVLSQTGVTPPGVDAGEGFFHLAADNRSDDLFQFMSRQVGPSDGLEPDTAYRVAFEVVFASNAPAGCVGIGGAPGESVWMKVGATPDQPMPMNEDGETRLAVDKGGQSEGGEAAEVAGVIANGIPCEEALAQDPTPYAMVTLSHTLSEAVTTDSDGALWLFVGVDSGFEGRTSIYYDSVTVTLMP